MGEIAWSRLFVGVVGGVAGFAVGGPPGAFVGFGAGVVGSTVVEKAVGGGGGPWYEVNHSDGPVVREWRRSGN